MNILRKLFKTREQRIVEYVRRNNIAVDSTPEKLRQHLARFLCVQYTFRDWCSVKRQMDDVDWQVVWEELTNERL